MHADKKQLVGKLVGIGKICRTSHETIVAMTLVNTIYCHTLLRVNFKLKIRYNCYVIYTFCK